MGKSALPPTYSIPNYGPGPKEPYMATLKDYPYQAVGEATLRDGTVIANIHNSLSVATCKT